MGLTKIDGFAGEAEILGGLYRVEFNNGTLAIKGIDLDGSYAVLDALASKQILAVRVQPGDRPAVATAQSVPVQRVDPKEVERAEKQVASTTKLAPAAFAGERESDRAARAAMEAMQETRASQAPKDAEPAPPATAGSPPPSSGTGGAGGAVPAWVSGGAVPEKVAGSKRFIEVLEWVMRERGLSVKDADALVAALEEIKPHVPVVQRVRDLKDKVVSNLAAWAENGAAA